MEDHIIECIKRWCDAPGLHVSAEMIGLSAQLLCPEALQRLLAELDLSIPSHREAHYLLQKELDRQLRLRSFKEGQERNLLRRNEPVASLLKWYNDRRSGRVVYARKELQRRFLYLSYREQLAVVRALLGGGKADRLWCYNTLRKWWSCELEGPVLEVWNAYHEERCGWLLTRYFPVEVLRQQLDSLDYDSNYYRLCKRLAGEDFFVVDSMRLLSVASRSQYMWIMSQTRAGLSAKEALEVVYGMIFGLLMEGDDEVLRESLIRNSVGGGLLVGVRAIVEDFYMCRIPDMDKVLMSMCRMGMIGEVEAFLKFDAELHEDFVRGLGDEMEVAEGEDSEHKVLFLEELWRRFVEFYCSRIPKEYRPAGLPNPDLLAGSVGDGESELDFVGDDAGSRGGGRRSMSAEELERAFERNPALRVFWEEMDMER